MSRVASNRQPYGHVIVRIQSVETLHLDQSSDSGTTIGNQVDQFIENCLRAGREPNKLVIDLNPPKEPQTGDLQADI